MLDDEMSNNTIPCDSDTIDSFLLDRLEEEQLRRFEDHLETCRACRDSLQEMAAEKSWWGEARRYLSGVAAGEAGSGGPVDPSFDTLSCNAHDAHDIALDFLAPTDDPRMLGRLGSYEIQGVIGRGGMGIVLKGVDTALNRYVAIKVLSPSLASNGAARNRFAREAQAAAAVVHDHVVSIHSVAEHNGLPYLVMPYIRGTSLQRRLDDAGPLALLEILRIARQCASGLAAAHAQGLVHRDIKPANILLADSVERIKITDFGLARAVDDASLTRTGVVAGTPQFMSPEQASGEAIDARSDLFSLGSVIYTMCTGRVPFRAETSLAVLRRITDSAPRPVRQLNPAIPEWLCEIVDRLHAKSPDDRFVSADALERLLEQCLAHVQDGTTELPAELKQRSQPKKRLLRQWAMALAVGGVLALVVGLAVVSRNDFFTETQSPPMDGTDNSNAIASPTDGAVDTTLIWDDDVDTSILQLNEQLRELDRRSRLLYGDHDTSH